jgi:hypothetical protein
VAKIVIQATQMFCAGFSGSRMPRLALPVLLPGPDDRSGGGIDQTHGGPHQVAVETQAAFEQMAGDARRLATTLLRGGIGDDLVPAFPERVAMRMLVSMMFSERQGRCGYRTLACRPVSYLPKSFRLLST